MKLLAIAAIAEAATGLALLITSEQQNPTKRKVAGGIQLLFDGPQIESANGSC